MTDVETKPDNSQWIGQIVEGEITGITSFGAFVRIAPGVEGLVHISEIADEYVTDVSQFVVMSEKVKVKVLGENKQKKLDLSIKQAKERKPRPEHAPARPHGSYAPHNSERLAPLDDSRAKPKSNFQLIGRYRRPTDDLSPFDSKINSFLKVSEEKLIDLKRNIQGKQGVIKRKRKLKP